MSDMWAHRERPTPLDFDEISEGGFEIPNKTQNGVSVNGNAIHNVSSLKDQKELSLQDSLVLFVSRYVSTFSGINVSNGIT